jgi:hypothetical protein
MMKTMTLKLVNVEEIQIASKCLGQLGFLGNWTIGHLKLGPWSRTLDSLDFDPLGSWALSPLGLLGYMECGALGYLPLGTLGLMGYMEGGALALGYLGPLDSWVTWSVGLLDTWPPRALKRDLGYLGTFVPWTLGLLGVGNLGPLGLMG